ncbi:hypothetical protein [uncultured Rothia sp.]|uniref:hypothetical protein n=1 Tax=uncultured Rothia sp. TaxID=316088 RepID=UPI0032174DE3
MVDEYSSQEPSKLSEDRDSAAITLWSLVLFLASSVALGLLVWLGTDQNLLPLCGLLIFSALLGLGLALLYPLYAASGSKAAAVVLTVLYGAVALVVGWFVLAMPAWALYSNGCCR